MNIEDYRYVQIDGVHVNVELGTHVHTDDDMSVEDAAAAIETAVDALAALDESESHRVELSEDAAEDTKDCTNAEVEAELSNAFDDYEEACDDIDEDVYQDDIERNLQLTDEEARVLEIIVEEPRSIGDVAIEMGTDFGVAQEIVYSLWDQNLLVTGPHFEFEADRGVPPNLREEEQ